MTNARRAFLALLGAGALACPAAAQMGQSAEDYVRMVPQAPRDVTVAVRGCVVVIRWRPPPEPPAGKLMYERAFSTYRVIRLRGDDETTVADTRATSATDRLRRGRASYVVATVQPSGRVGVRSSPVEARCR